MKLLLAAVGVLAAACSGGLAGEFPDPPVNRGIDSVMPTTVLDTADGARILTLVATVDSQWNAPGTVVTFVTTVGTLLPAGTGGSVAVAVDANRQATVQLKAPADSSVGFVVASLGGSIRSIPVAFLPAPPSFINIVPSASVLSATSPVTIAVALARYSGTTSPGFLMQFSATRTGTDISVGQFSTNSVIASANAASVTYSVAGETYTGPVTISVTASRGPLRMVGTDIIQLPPVTSTSGPSPSFAGGGRP